MQLPSNLWKSTAPTYLDLVLGLESAYPQELHGVQCEQQNGENKVTQCLYTLYEYIIQFTCSLYPASIPESYIVKILQFQPTIKQFKI